MKANLSYILLFFQLFCFQISIAQEPVKESVPNQLPVTTKKIIKELTSTKQDSLLNKKVDTVATNSIKKPKEVIDYVVTHDAEDYTIQNAKNKTVTLYNKAHVIYGDIDLKAGKIIVDYKNNTVYATGIKDSTGTKYIQRPVFKQGSQESEQDSILFNFKTKKALVYGVKTVQGEMITYGEKTKRVNDSTIYMRKLRFTTSKKKNPDYYIATNKAKLVPGKKIIVGGSQLVIADVPTPVYLPFAYFPLSEKRTSGFIIPTPGENNQQGFSLVGGGYYFAINDYFDLETTADIFTNGSWAVRLKSSYNVRYKFSGNISFLYQNLISGIRGFSNYSKASEYKILWSYNEDSKSSPNSSFGASVNFGSATYDRNNLTNINIGNSLQNTFGSSINYGNKLNGIPFDFNANIRHSQNVNTRDVSINTSVRSNMETLNPFQGKGGVRKNPLQKLRVNYNVSADYSINTKDSLLFTPIMYKTAQKKVTHNASASTNIKLLKYLTLTPSASYNEFWFFDRIQKKYDPNIINKNGTLGNIRTDTISKFNRYNQYSFNANLSTVVYGTFNFKKGRIKTIRHTLTPSISFSYTPSFEHFYETVQQNSLGETLEYSPFPSGRPSKEMSGTINFSVSNNLEAKVKRKEDDTVNDNEDEYKKIKLLNNLQLSTSYNIAADSVKWSPLTAGTIIPLYKNKISLNLNATFDFYKINDKGNNINQFNDKLLRLTNAGFNTSFSISSKDFETKNTSKDNNTSTANNDVYKIGYDQNLNNFAHTANKSSNKEEKEVKTKLYKAKIPWDLTVNYNFNYSKRLIVTRGNSLTIDGNVELSPKWKVGITSGYDFEGEGVTRTQFRFSRDLDSWKFNFAWTPFGEYTSYFFFIGVKSSMLSDLQWKKNKPPDRRLF